MADVSTAECTHGDHVHEIQAGTDGCEECLQSGDQWVHLRLCMECGHVGCCDSSKNRHATAHFHATQHPIIVSFEPGEDWGWCYLDELALDGEWPIDGPRHHSREANAHRAF